ncbi:hypothetical protein [Halostella sp. PRR32]|uniref:hypothetical protein n=1 Tax=Halostella sp. PRR32 TaxID=3098147 RepID=UPI002B1E04A4|nr:hypothetical protein [Halostella sp. PRR32]
MKRRDVLKSVSVAGGLSVAGCISTLSVGNSGTVLGKIEVINSSFVANRIRLLVKRDEDLLIDREVTLTAIDVDDSAALSIIEPMWPKTQAPYTIRAIHYDESGNRESIGWEYTFTKEDYDMYYKDSHKDPGCIGAIVKIGSLADTPNAPIGIGPIYRENPCGVEDPE